MNVYLAHRNTENAFPDGEDYAMVVVAENEDSAAKLVDALSSDFKNSNSFTITEVKLDHEHCVLTAN